MKNIPHICKYCKLFNDVEHVCGVVVMYRGQKLELNVHPLDECHWERVDQEIQNELREALGNVHEPFFREKLREELNVPIEVKQIRAWSDGKNGYLEY